MKLVLVTAKDKSLSSLKVGDVFTIPHSNGDEYALIRGWSGVQLPFIFNYVCLNGASQFMVFGTDKDLAVNFLGRMKNE